ncbi:MAG: alpha/beta hydrolase [Candidatus Binatia bacterium]
MRVEFRCADLQLEGDLLIPPECRRGAVICHPHPQYGGDMDNAVVCAVTTALHHSGLATLRFNFRGAGASQGTYANGIGEVEDVRAAVRFLVERSAVRSLTLAGYSFGAMVVLRAWQDVAAVDRLIAVAPPLAFFDLTNLASCTAQKLFILGDRDQYCSVAQLTEQLRHVADPKAHSIVGGADHFFAGYEPTLAEAVRAFVS